MEVSGVATYLYNGLQQRVAKNANGALSHYAYDESSRLIGEYNATGQAVNETVYLFGQPVAVLKGAEVFNVHADHLGSPRKISNQAGTVVWAWAEQPFGDVAANQDPDNDGVAFEYNLRFPGQYFDRETGLYYNFHRYYDAQTGRYITSDPIGLAGGLNTYGYVGGNPLSFTDSLGLLVTPETGLDIISLALSINEYNNDPSFANGLGLAYDGFATAAPFLPAGFGIIKKICAADIDSTKTIEELLKGTGQIPALLRNENLKGVDVQSLLGKTLDEVRNELTDKQFKTFMKHFENRDLRHGK